MNNIPQIKFARIHLFSIIAGIFLFLCFSGITGGSVNAQAGEIKTPTGNDQLGQGQFYVEFPSGSFPQQLKIAILEFLEKNTNSIPTTMRVFTLTVEYFDANNIQHFRLFPSEIVESNWELPINFNDIISIYSENDGAGNQIISFEKPINPTLRMGAPNYSLPWRLGQSWSLTQGTHSVATDKYALDFAPNTGASNDVLAMEAGLLTASCYRSDDPIQAMVLIRHSNGDYSGYLHLDKASVTNSSAGKFNTSISKGTKLGGIYTGTGHVNPLPLGCDSSMRFYSPCGCGTGPHLHLSLTKTDMYIQGMSQRAIDEAPGDYSFISNNGPVPATPKSVTATTDQIKKVVITWGTASGATRYEVWRWRTNLPTWATRLSSSATSPYSDTTSTVDQTYNYWVKGCNSVGCSGFSTHVIGNSIPQPPITPHYVYLPVVVNASSTEPPFTHVFYIEPTLSPGYTGDLCTTGWLRINGWQSDYRGNEQFWDKTASRP